MNRAPLTSLLVAATFLLFPRTTTAQAGGTDVYWHIDPSVKSCSMVIDPSLTQAQWKRFAEQAGAIISFKPLASAEPLGKHNVTVGLDYSSTAVDQRDPAWINTFTHPDETCPLGDHVVVPTLRARVGVSDRMDFGASWTKAPRANYGYVSGEVRYALLAETAHRPAAAVRTSMTVLTGVPDFNYIEYGAEWSASKRLAAFTPFLGTRGNFAVATETTSKVDLRQERLFLPQAFIGTTYSVWKFDLAAEYDIAKVNTIALIVGVRP
ncbi:MAG: hypothetical protein ACM3JJ_10150 [Hyphomicrobiales bacterium]